MTYECNNATEFQEALQKAIVGDFLLLKWKNEKQEIIQIDTKFVNVKRTMLGKE